MKLFFTGPVINADMLVAMLEKHGIVSERRLVIGESSDDEDLNRLAEVYVPDAEYARAHRLFYTEREDEL